VTWVKLDDGFAEHENVAEIDDRAFRWFVWSLCYAARHLTRWLCGTSGAQSSADRGPPVHGRPCH
jgi:hypothetical protein